MRERAMDAALYGLLGASVLLIGGFAGLMVGDTRANEEVAAERERANRAVRAAIARDAARVEERAAGRAAEAAPVGVSTWRGR